MQTTKEPFTFGRLKCRSAASGDNYCDSREHLRKSSNPNLIESRGVHTIKTPWLVAEKDRSRAIRHGDSDNKKVDSTNKNRKNLRSVLCLQKRNASVEDKNDVVPTSKPKPLSQPPHHVFPGVKNMNYDESTLSESHNNESSSFGPSDETHSTIDSLDDKPSREVVLVPSPTYNDTARNIIRISGNNLPISSPFTKQMESRNKYIEHQHPEFRTKGNETDAMEFSGWEITTPKRRNTRSPSPSKLRGRAESQERTFEYQRHIYSDYDREILMGFEMQRDLDRMSLNCGATGVKALDSSHPGVERNSHRKNSKGFTILPSSMSCFNPAAELDTFETTEGNVHKINIHNEKNRIWVDKNALESARSKPMKKYFCSGASSALLCDVNDDDALWEYYDDRKPIYQSSIPDRRGAEIEARESNYSQNSLIEQREESYAIGEPILSNNGDRYDNFGHSMSNGVPKDNDSNDVPTFENTRHLTRRKEESDPSLTSETPIVFGSEDRYESLMSYSTQSRNDQEELQITKEELLNEMRHAVQKASARLKKTKTMETEYSDESSYVSNLLKQQRTQSLQIDLEKRPTSDFFNNSKRGISLQGTERDKYDFN